MSARILLVTGSRVLAAADYEQRACALLAAHAEHYAPTIVVCGDADAPAAPPSASPAPPSASARASVAADLDALARCLPALLGSAMPIVRIPGGQSAGSPAEHVQPWLTAARRAMRRLAGLRAVDHGAALLLLAVYVQGGEEARRLPSWVESMYLALLPRAERVLYLATTKGPDAGALRAAARRALLAAEEAYASATDAPSDGRWLSSDLDAVSRAVRGMHADRAEVEASRPKATKVRAKAIVSTDCALCVVRLDVPAFAPCASRAGRVNARACGDRAQGKRAGRSCVRTKDDRWKVRSGALVVSERSGERGYRRTVESRTFALLQSVSESKR